MNADAAAFVREAERGQTCAAASLVAIKQDLAALDRLADGRSPRELKPTDIRAFVVAENRRGLAASSLRRMLSTWRKFFQHLADNGLITSNPARGIRAPRATRPLVKALSPDEAKRLLDRSSPSSDLARRDMAMLETAYSSALRVSELVGLDCSDIDMRDKTLTVRHGKGSKQRVVPLGDKALEALNAWLPIRQRICKSAAGALFVNQRGGRLTARSVQLRIKACAQQAGLPSDITPHVLRHSCASHLLQSSGDLRGVQEMLGHASISSTQVYTHLDFQALAKVYDQAHPRAKRGKQQD